MLTNVDTILYQAYLEELNNIPSEEQKFLENRIFKIVFPSLETGVGSFSGPEYYCTPIKKMLYRIPPDLTRQICEKYETQELENAHELFQQIAKTVICTQKYNCYYTAIGQKGFAKSYMSFWEELKKNGFTDDYKCIHNLIADPFTVSSGEEKTLLFFRFLMINST